MLLQQATLATLDPLQVRRASLRIEDGIITESGESCRPAAGEEVLELDGALILPGLVNAHTHLYSALARGMPSPTDAPRSFIDILERVWWKLDRALDEETVQLSGLVGAMDAARSGTTLLVDHHASPSFIRGSLEVLRRAVDAVGLRSLLAYETTDRNGSLGRDDGLEENRSFLAGSSSGRGLPGAHASFTLSDESLEGLAKVVRESRSPLHIHVAEDRHDVDDCFRRCGTGVVERLRRHGLLEPNSLLVHGVHLTSSELSDLEAAGAWLVHCPRSNMNTAVGTAATEGLARVALGTDGLDEDMLAEVRGAFLSMRSAGREDAFAASLDMLAGGHRLARALLSSPFGQLAAGSPADLVILDYRPPTPITSASLGGHLLFGIDRSHVQSTMVAGRFVVRNRRLMLVDEAAIASRARRAAARLWEEMGR